KEQVRYSDASNKMIFMQLAKVFAHNRYRQLYIYALHQYWTSTQTDLSEERLQVFNGLTDATETVEKLKNQMQADDNEALVYLLRIFNLLKRLESTIQEKPDEKVKSFAEFYREKGYLLLDWQPALSGLVIPSVSLNLFIQTSICFLRASRFAQNELQQMTDEKLAL